MTEVVIVDALRTAIGNLQGSLAGHEAHQLGAPLIKALMARNKIEADAVSEVILGQVLTAAKGQNPARQTVILAGLDKSVPAVTINQVCGSGLRAVALACQAIKAGDSKIVFAGGQESMSRAPHAAMLRSGIKMGNAALIDTMQEDGLTDAFNHYAMGITAENVAKEWKIDRATQDEFSARSQQKAKAAQKAGNFMDEILPIKIKIKKDEVDFAEDEFIRPGTTAESLGKLRPVFIGDGTVTAGNASGINDGAAILLIMSADEAQRRNLTPLATISSWAHVGVAPEIMGTGPINAIKLALKKAEWDLKDVDLFEANEAFAAQALAVSNELGLDPQKVNVNGGAIALGHPIGASGARVLTTLLYQMRRQNAKRGVAALCIGGGMGIAMCVSRA